MSWLWEALKASSGGDVVFIIAMCITVALGEGKQRKADIKRWAEWREYWAKRGRK